MYISHIVSTKNLKSIKGRPFHMALSNIAMKNSNYLNFYKKESSNGSFILLDNGVAEKDQLTIEQVWKISELIKPTEIVLHDKILDSKKTHTLSLQSYEYYKNNNFSGLFMFVPQGKNLQEWIQSFDNFYKLNLANSFGISKFLNHYLKDYNIRLEILKYLNTNYKDLTIHLLGCEYNIFEYKTIIDNNFENLHIRSGDTALAYIYTLNNKYINLSNRPLDKNIEFLNQSVNSGLLNLNINIFDKIIKGEKKCIN